jgi:hypothetical protein
LELFLCLAVGIWSFIFGFTFSSRFTIVSSVTLETFKPELADAMKAYDKYVICLNKTPEDFHTSLVSLVNKAIKAYESRGPLLRHGIALDRHVTVILSQSEGPRPLCGIYFNLHSPYQNLSPTKAIVEIGETVRGSQPKSEG